MAMGAHLPLTMLPTLSRMGSSENAFERVRAHAHSGTRILVSDRVRGVFNATLTRPISGVSSQGPGIVSYGHLVGWLYRTLYLPAEWRDAVITLAELEAGNATRILEAFHQKSWMFQPDESRTDGESSSRKQRPTSEELGDMVVCVCGPDRDMPNADGILKGDSYDAERKSLDYWKEWTSNRSQEGFRSV